MESENIDDSNSSNEEDNSASLLDKYLDFKTTSIKSKSRVDKVHVFESKKQNLKEQGEIILSSKMDKRPASVADVKQSGFNSNHFMINDTFSDIE